MAIKKKKENYKTKTQLRYVRHGRRLRGKSIILVVAKLAAPLTPLLTASHCKANTLPSSFQLLQAPKYSGDFFIHTSSLSVRYIVCKKPSLNFIHRLLNQMH